MSWARQHQRSSVQRLTAATLPVTTALEALRRRDPCTFAHTDRVVRYAQLLGRVIGLSLRELGMLELGVRLHDIGKLFVPDRILHKPGPLSRAEWAVMRRHPALGGDVLRNYYAIAPEVIEVVTTHHERFDGGGYPFGYRGREIPLATRICALADTLDALTSNRSYRIPVTFHEAYREIFLESGCHFDPLVIDALSTIPPDLWADTIPRTPIMAFPALPPSGMDYAGIGAPPSPDF